MDQIFYEILLKFVAFAESDEGDEDDLMALVEEAKEKIALYEKLYID